MPLSIRDGNSSLTTLSTLVVNSAHVPAHTVVSLGSQAITDIAQAVSGVELGPNTINALENISVTFGTGASITVGNTVSVTGGLTNSELRASSVTIGGSVQVSNFPATQAVSFGAISGSVTATISGTPSVTFSSIQISNFPVTQTTTFGAITGSVSVLNLPATQAVTFSSVQISNFPATQVVTGTVELGPNSLTALENITVTLGQVTITGGLTNAELRASPVTIGGSVSATISGTPSVTFSQASVTFGAVTGSVSVLNFPPTQTVAGTVTANVSANIANEVENGLNAYASNYNEPLPIALPAGVASLPVSGTVTARGNLIGSGQEGTGFLLLALDDAGIQNPVIANGDGHLLVSVQSGTVTANLSSANLNSVTIGVRGTVTVGNSVTIGSLPAISGTVTVSALPDIIFQIETGINGSHLGYSVAELGNPAPPRAIQIGIGEDPFNPVSTSNPFPISGTVTVGNSVTIGSCVTHGVRLQDGSGNNLTSTSIGGVQRLNVSLASAATAGGTLPSFINIHGGTDGSVARTMLLDSSGRTVVTGTVTPSILDFSRSYSASSVTALRAHVGWGSNAGAFFYETNLSQPFPVQVVSSGTISVSQASTVTVSALPSGALTTRFGSVTTANTAQITSAVTNTSRKYLLAQNTSAGTVTIGIGFSPTTTQGIQLTSGAGLTFDAFCPTGAVYWLGAVTGAAFTILEA